MAAKLIHEERDVGNLLYHPFAVVALLPRPSQRVQVVEGVFHLLQVGFLTYGERGRKG